tara:strand:+ start:136 stop:447 length:312 start_codon:yes stop_codon:yes gene_type:complete
MLGPMCLFDNGNESVGVFPLGQLSAIEAGDDVVEFHFGHHSNKHTVVCACADGNSDVIVRNLAAFFAPLGKFHQKLITVADDANSVYLDSLITGVTSITFDEG